MSDNDRKQQRLIVLSGPSGCGKATLLKYVTDHTDIKRVITYTTRKPRPGEVDGRDYHFVSKAGFDRMYRDGELIEAEQVYGDFFYGSPKDIFSGASSDVIMELDTKGTENYRRFYSDIVTIFILPPSIDELVRRIKTRHPEANFKQRLQAAHEQLESAQLYDFIVVNDEVERVGPELLDIIEHGSQHESRDQKLQLAAALSEAVSQKYTA
ncbi:MAG: guanylate kinase [candidate division Zixibacteria bacterium]|nr:guanylate kinase [candidate division Zixibacteria bacterium]MBU1469952.1 guanylate kinase [candidate division Zixibacteria bacterium]MBU2626065.1 guanylate kinase [candidate division Zixibacteria bacterium]